jgi:hypothetical protein
MTTTDETTPDLAEVTTAFIRSYFATVDRLIDDLTDALGIDCDNLVGDLARLKTLAEAAKAEPEDDGWQDATVEALEALPVGAAIEYRTPGGRTESHYMRCSSPSGRPGLVNIGVSYHLERFISGEFRVKPGTIVGRTYPDGAAVAAAVRSRELPHDAVLRRDNDIGWHHFARSVVDSYAEPFTVVHVGSGLS